MKKYLVYWNPCDGYALIRDDQERAYLDWTLKHYIPTEYISKGSWIDCHIICVTKALVMMAEDNEHDMYQSMN